MVSGEQISLFKKPLSHLDEQKLYPFDKICPEYHREIGMVAMIPRTFHCLSYSNNICPSECLALPRLSLVVDEELNISSASATSWKSILAKTCLAVASQRPATCHW